MLAELTGARLHVAHISSAGAVDLVRRARERGLSVTAEVTPHHLALTDEATLGYDTNTKMAPPLRSAKDVEACRRALSEGVIDVIATDHAPHAVHEKEVEFTEAPPGVLGFETAYGVVMDMVRNDELTPLELMRRMSTNSTRIMNVPGGSLAVGSPGDVVVLDPERTWTYDPAKGYSKSRNSPWAGQQLTGRVIATVVGGGLVYHSDRGVLVP
jgi:dihydroorotase